MFYVISESGTGSKFHPIRTRYWDGKKWRYLPQDAKGFVRRATAERHAEFNIFLDGWKTRIVDDKGLRETSPA